MVVNWHINYLKNRKQKTVVNGRNSNSKVVSYGVPQGSTLGPLLFLIYTNDLFYIHVFDSETVHIYMYADDIVLVSSDLTPKEAVLKNQKALDKLSLWCKQNKLTINQKKQTKHIFFGTANMVRCCNHKITYDGLSLANVPTYNYLGVMMDKHLSYEKHLRNLIKKISHKTLKKTRLEN